MKYSIDDFKQRSEYADNVAEKILYRRLAMYYLHSRDRENCQNKSLASIMAAKDGIITRYKELSSKLDNDTKKYIQDRIGYLEDLVSSVRVYDEVSINNIQIHITTLECMLGIPLSYPSVIKQVVDKEMDLGNQLRR